MTVWSSRKRSLWGRGFEAKVSTALPCTPVCANLHCFYLWEFEFWIHLSSVLFLSGCECLSPCQFSPACPQFCSCLTVGLAQGQAGASCIGKPPPDPPRGICGAASPHCLPSAASPKGKISLELDVWGFVSSAEELKKNMLNSTYILAYTHWVLLFTWILLPFNLLRSYEKLVLIPPPAISSDWF